LFGLRGITLGAFGGLEDQGFGLRVGGFEHVDVAIEFADILTDERVAFPFLDRISGGNGGHMGGRGMMGSPVLLA